MTTDPIRNRPLSRPPQRKLFTRFGVVVASIGLPTAAAAVLSLIAGGLQVLNEVVFSLAPEWHAFVTLVLVFLAGVGISPLVGPQFRAALHLPAWVGILITSAAGAGTLALTLVHMSSTAHAIIAAVLTVITGLGFAPSIR